MSPARFGSQISQITCLYHILNVFYKSVALVAAAFESSVRSALQLSLPRRIAESIIFEQMASLSELSYALFFGPSKIFSFSLT